MKLFITAIVSTVFSAAFASVSSGIWADPAHPGKCVYKNLVLSPGDNGFPEGVCEHFFCFKSSGFGEIQDCAIQVAVEPCTLGELKLPDSHYPYCCERYVMCPV
ncbi:uncharacterized protein [Musca autumnalis]|uniref:uncharacterized protein n=1 Tax=Musca autumnalis TaxID=221902 RepID=UPI003CEBD0C2